MLTSLLSVDKHLAVLIHSLEVQPEAFSIVDLQFRVLYLLAIPPCATRIISTAIACGSISTWLMVNVPVVRQIHALPFGVIEHSKMSVRNILLNELPSEVKTCYLALSC